MTEVDTDKFAPSTQMPSRRLEAKGKCIEAKCVVVSYDNHEIALASNSVEGLQMAFQKLIGINLDEAGIQDIAIFSKNSLQP